MSKIESIDLIGDKFIKFMESQGIEFVDVVITGGHDRKEIETKTGKRVVSKKKFIAKSKNKLLEDK